MIARRLLVGGVATFPAIPPDDPVVAFTVVPAEAGAWTEVQGPHASYANGRTYIATVGGNGKNNDIEVWEYVHATETLNGPVLLHDNLSDGLSTDPDSHNGPAVIVRPDGHIVVAYMGHVSGTIRAKVSNEPYDIVSGFSTAFAWTPISGGLTYPQLSYITDSGLIYLTFRRQSGGAGQLVRCHSSDGGETFGNGTVVYTSGTDNEYSAFACDGEAIHFAVTNKHADDADYGLYYFNMDPATGDLNAADGTLLVANASLPAGPGDLTEIVAAPGDNYPYGVSFTSDGRPVISYQTKSADPVELGEWRWSGSAWEKHVIDTTDGIAPDVLSVGGGAHDWDDANRFCAPKMVDGEMEIMVYTSTDDGETWTGQQLDAVPGVTGPHSVVAVQPRGPELGWLWFDDLFAHSSDFENGLHGAP